MNIRQLASAFCDKWYSVKYQLIADVKFWLTP